VLIIANGSYCGWSVNQPAISHNLRLGVGNYIFWCESGWTLGIFSEKFESKKAPGIISHEWFTGAEIMNVPCKSAHSQIGREV